MKTIIETYRSDLFKLVIGFVLLIILVYFGIFLMLENLSSINNNLETISAQPAYTMASHHFDLTKETSEELVLLTDSKIQITRAVMNIKFILLCGVLVLIVFIAVIFRDSRLNKKYRDQIIEEKRRAELLADVKQQFIANMSHEMKTPLHAINGFTNQLMQQASNPNQWDTLNKIENSSARLVNMIEDLLILSNENILKESVQNTPFDLAKVFKEIEDVYNEKTLEKGLKFITLFPLPMNGITFIGDCHRLKHIINNLLDNSLKFTVKGSIELWYYIEKTDPLHCNLHITVKDTGIGIEEDRVEVIFNEFEQLDDSLTKEYSGIGIGLSVAKKLVEWQGGTIKVKSKQHKYTEFKVSMPYLISQDEPLQEEVTIETPLKVLVVDDDPYNLMVASAMLKKHNCFPDKAINGEEALEMATKKKYDIILMDIHMPRISGIEVSERIRKSEKNTCLNNSTPIVALTATLINQKQTDKFREAGINDYLSKPYNEMQLWKKLQEYIPAPIQPISTMGNNTQNNSEIYNLDALKEITADDPEFLIEMLETFVINNKIALKELNQSYELKKLKEIGEIAHKMLSSYQHIKVQSLYETLSGLEGLIWKVEPPANINELIVKLNSVSNELFLKLEVEIKDHSI